MADPILAGMNASRFAAAQRPLRAVICGEVSAGKSTVINAVLREPLLPDNIGQARRPVVNAIWQPEPGIESWTPDGRRIRAELPGSPDLFHAAERVTISLNRPHLAGLELIEVPLTTAENLTAEQIELISSAHVLIWVTIASQAWRLTEKAILDAISGMRPHRAILVVTRADKLRSDADREKLMGRIQRETAGLFRSCIFLNGEKRRIAESGHSEQVWAETGGAAITEWLLDCASDLHDTDAGPDPYPDTYEDEAPCAAAPDRPAAAPGDAGTTVASGSAPERPVFMRGGVTVPAALAAGIVPEDETADYIGLQGEPHLIRIMGDLCARAMTGLSGAWPARSDRGPVLAFSLSTQSRRLLFQVAPGLGFVFLLADAALLSQGLAYIEINRLIDELGASDTP